jgi:hypothetical protein
MLNLRLNTLDIQGSQKNYPELDEAGVHVSQPPDLREGDERAMAARLHAVEKHLRKNPLQGGTFVDKLQRSTCVQVPWKIETTMIY